MEQGDYWQKWQRHKVLARNDSRHSGRDWFSRLCEEVIQCRSFFVIFRVAGNAPVGSIDRIHLELHRYYGRVKRCAILSKHGQQRPQSISNSMHSLRKTCRHFIGPREKLPTLFFFAIFHNYFWKSEIFLFTPVFTFVFREMWRLHGGACDNLIWFHELDWHPMKMKKTSGQCFVYKFTCFVVEVGNHFHSKVSIFYDGLFLGWHIVTGSRASRRPCGAWKARIKLFFGKFEPFQMTKIGWSGKRHKILSTVLSKAVQLLWSSPKKGFEHFAETSTFHGTNRRFSIQLGL